jgi:hemerythrin superfamily protein
MNAVDLLTDQHRALESKMETLLDTDDPGQRAGLLAQVGDHLSVHIASEEQVFYPAVKARRTKDILLESLEEHLSLKRLLSDLLELDPTGQTFIPKFKVLAEQTEHHHKEEEEHLFPKVRKLLDDPQLDTLGREMMALQNQLCSEGRPRETVSAETGRAAPLQ